MSLATIFTCLDFIHFLIVVVIVVVVVVEVVVEVVVVMVVEVVEVVVIARSLQEQIVNKIRSLINHSLSMTYDSFQSCSTFYSYSSFSRLMGHGSKADSPFSVHAVGPRRCRKSQGSASTKSPFFIASLPVPSLDGSRLSAVDRDEFSVL